ncbi:MAG: TonB-dependent receptor [Gammaproteobacteria bacterium]
MKSSSQLSLAICLALAAAAANAKPVSVDLPAQPLAQSIHQLADRSGMSVSVDSALLAGKTAPAVKGNLEPADALKRLLAGTNLDAVVSGDKVTITPASARLGKVQVEGEGVEDGSEAVGYRVDTMHHLGPWGDVKAIDTPYTTFALSEEMMKNSFVSSPFLIERVLPLTGLDEFQISGQGSFVGFRGVGSSTPLINGMRSSNGYGIFLENVGSVEVLSGYSGFMYGVGAGGGLQIYNLKRPTRESTTDLTVGHTATGGYHGDADVSRQFADGMFGVRVNLMAEGGDTAIDHQSSRKRLASVGLDFNPIDQLKIQADAYYGTSRLDGLRGSFSSFNTPALTPNLDNSGLWGPAGTFSDVETRYFDLAAQYQISDAIKARAAFNHKTSEYKSSFAFGSTTFTGTTATSFTRTTRGTGNSPTTDGGYAYLDGAFKTGSVEHSVTAGFNGYDLTGRTGLFNNGGTLATLLSSGATTFQWGDKAGVEGLAVPDFFANFTDFKKSGKSHVYNYLVADTVKFTDQWILMAGVNKSQVKQENFNALNGVRTGVYSSDATTPSASLLFKPRSNLTTYITYMQSLDPGQIVPSTYKNAGEVLSPTKSKEYEAGVKYELPGGALLTAALYRMDIGSILSDDSTIFGTLTQNGRQRNQGLDVTFSGKVTDNLALTGGYAYIQALYKKTTDPRTDDTHPWGVPPHIVKLTADYATPFLSGLFLTGGAYYNGTSYSTTVSTTNLNNAQYPGYVELDLGARYATSINDTRTIYRLNIANLLDKNQWSYGDLNYPRTVSLSATVSF